MTPRGDGYDDGYPPEPDFPITCSSCGAEWHGGDGGDCPNCGRSSYSYASADADAWTRWAEDTR